MWTALIAILTFLAGMIIGAILLIVVAALVIAVAQNEDKEERECEQ